MKVLITGWRGFIGKNLIPYLEKNGHTVIKMGENLMDYENIHNAFAEQPDAVIHLAAYGNDSSHDQKTVEGITKTIETNVVGSALLVSEFIKSKARVFINTGSSSEYGIHRESLKPTLTLEGETPYARSKAALSTLLYNLDVEGKHFKTIRLFSVYGPHEKENRLIPTAFRAAMTGETMPVSLAVHDFVYIDDVCRSYLHLLEMPEICPPITHAASGKQYTNQDVIDLIQDITGMEINTYPVSQLRSFDTSFKWVSNVGPIVAEPIYTLSEGLKKTWQFLLNN